MFFVVGKYQFFWFWHWGLVGLNLYIYKYSRLISKEKSNPVQDINGNVQKVMGFMTTWGGGGGWLRMDGTVMAWW